MTYRLEVDTAMNCRPKKGERCAKDGTGRLVKCSIYFGANRLECLREAKKAAKAGAEIAPGYAEVIEVRGYDKIAYDRDPLTAVAEYQAKTL